MQNVKLKHLTETSWLVLTGDGFDRIGLLAQQREHFIFIANDIKKQFASKEEIVEFFGRDVFSDAEGRTIEETAEYFVNGYPVDVKPIEVIIDGEIELGVFKKRANSAVIYTAGYFCLSYPTGWVSSRCPKYSTLCKYEYKGPFKTEKEMKFVLSRARKE